MKIAKVIPLYKSGEKNVFTNYRPISLLPQFSKCIDFVEEITTSLDNNKYTVAIFIDPKKAFATIDHDILCKKNCISVVCVVSHRNGFRVI